jgi:hypothetical protein
LIVFLLGLTLEEGWRRCISTGFRLGLLRFRPGILLRTRKRDEQQRHPGRRRMHTA